MPLVPVTDSRMNAAMVCGLELDHLVEIAQRAVRRFPSALDPVMGRAWTMPGSAALLQLRLAGGGDRRRGAAMIRAVSGGSSGGP